MLSRCPSLPPRLSSPPPAANAYDFAQSSGTPVRCPRIFHEEPPTDGCRTTRPVELHGEEPGVVHGLDRRGSKRSDPLGKDLRTHLGVVFHRDGSELRLLHEHRSTP